MRNRRSAYLNNVARGPFLGYEKLLSAGPPAPLLKELDFEYYETLDDKGR